MGKTSLAQCPIDITMKDLYLLLFLEHNDIRRDTMAKHDEEVGEHWRSLADFSDSAGIL